MHCQVPLPKIGQNFRDEEELSLVKGKPKFLNLAHTESHTTIECYESHEDSENINIKDINLHALENITYDEFEKLIDQL